MKCQTLMDLLSFHPRMQLRDLNCVLVGHQYQGMVNGRVGKEGEIFISTIDWVFSLLDSERLTSVGNPSIKAALENSLWIPEYVCSHYLFSECTGMRSGML